MFQTLRRFQGPPINSRPSFSTSSATSKLFRDNLRVAGGMVSVGVSRRSALPANTNYNVCWALTRQHVRRDLWSYVGLAGLLSIYLGILVCVYALKGVFAHRGVMTLCGVLLNGVGGVNLLVSWLCYRCHRKHRRLSLCCCSSGGDGDGGGCCGGGGADHDPPPLPKTRPQTQSLGFLTPEFAKYAEFNARDRRYDSKRHHFFKAYEPTRISISFAHKYWLEQQKPLLDSGFVNPTLFPSSVSSSFPASPRNKRIPRSSEPKRKLLEVDPNVPRRQRST